jgi:hypothetical protein
MLCNIGLRKTFVMVGSLRGHKQTLSLNVVKLFFSLLFFVKSCCLCTLKVISGMSIIKNKVGAYPIQWVGSGLTHKCQTTQKQLGLDK